METFSRSLAYALLALLGSLPLGCLFAGLIYGLLAFAFGQTGISEGLGLGLVISIPAILVGVIPAFLYGAPVYAFVASRGYANYLSTAVIGAAIASELARSFRHGPRGAVWRFRCMPDASILDNALQDCGL